MPYPWEDKLGLAPVLRDPGIWLRVFDTPDLRRLVKRALTQTRRTWPGGPGVAVTDDAAFAPVALEVMASPAARAKLRSFMRSHLQVRAPEQELASRAYHRICRTEDEAGSPRSPLPQDDVICEERGDAWFLDPGKFATWLQETSLSEEDLPVVAGFAASFAMLQPELRRVLPDLLLEKDPRFKPLIVDAG